MGKRADFRRQLRRMEKLEKEKEPERQAALKERLRNEYEFAKEVYLKNCQSWKFSNGEELSTNGEKKTSQDNLDNQLE